MASLVRSARATVARVVTPMKQCASATRCMSSLHDRERAMEVSTVLAYAYFLRPPSCVLLFFVGDGSCDKN